MNRGRGLSGRDGYARVLGIDVAGILRARLMAAPEGVVSEGAAPDGVAAPDRMVRWRGALVRAVSWLTTDGHFVANFDATGIRFRDDAPATRRLTTALRAPGFTYDARARRVSRHGHADVEFGFRYLGADDRAGPNYTGQPAVHSYYER